jgi:endonuclease YncB( thermonuclease family)
MSKLWTMFLLATFLGVNSAQPAEWERLDRCFFDRKNFADGDSFHVKHLGKSHIFRLYWVDTPEPKSMGLTDRTTVQAKYFDILKRDLYLVADEASLFAANALRQPFTVWTKWEDARGQSREPRYYAVVQLGNGEDMAEALVKNGLARIFGQQSDHPDGRKNAQVIADLKKLEQDAKKNQVGGWKYTRSPKPK